MAAPHIPPWAHSWVVWSAVKPCCACESFSRSWIISCTLGSGRPCPDPWVRPGPAAFPRLGWELRCWRAEQTKGHWHSRERVDMCPRCLQAQLKPMLCTYACLRCNVMEGTLGLFGSSVCQELEAKKRQENKIKRKRSHARWTAMFLYLLCLQCFVNRFQSVFRWMLCQLPVSLSCRFIYCKLLMQVQLF